MGGWDGYLRRLPLHSAGLYALIAALVGLLVIAVLPLAFVNGQGALFQQGDLAQHVSGWQAYRADRWHFPLLLTTRLNAPEGVSIAFTDSIPLAALGFKLLAPWLPAEFHYFGLWHLLAGIAQALGGAFLVRSLGARRWFAALAGALLAVLTPALALRLGHTALLTHALVLVALGLYFRGLDRQRDENRDANRHQTSRPNARAAGLLGATAIVGLLVHPYWLAMCSGVFFAFVLDSVRAGLSTWLRALRRLLLFTLTLVAVITVFGYGGSGSLSTGGFGEFSMNLFAPFCGGRLTNCWVDATGGQYEGHNYLGAGVLFVLLPVAAVVQLRDRRRFARSIWRHAGLALVMLAFTLYSLSDQVYAGEALLVQWPVPNALLALAGIFRASGRFFWIVGYLITFAALATTLKTLQPRRALALAVVVLAVQAWDVLPLWQVFAHRVAEPARDELAPWQRLMQGVEQVKVHPAFGCGRGTMHDYIFLQRLATSMGATVDTAYIARAAKECAVKQEPFEAAFARGALYALLVPTAEHGTAAMPAGFRKALARQQCALWQEILLCRVEFSPDAWRAQPLPVILPNPPPAGADDVLDWPAAQLPTQVGILAGAELQPADGAPPGYLSYGPYARLEPGRYVVELGYRSALPEHVTVGRWDAVAAPVDGAAERNYAQGSVLGTLGQMKQLRFALDVAAGDGPLEVRVFYPGDGDLRIRQLRVVRPR